MAVVILLSWLLGALIGILLMSIAVRLGVRPVVEELRAVRSALEVAHDLVPDED